MDQLLNIKLQIPPEFAAAVERAVFGAQEWRERLEKVVWLDGLRTGLFLGILVGAFLVALLWKWGER